MGGSPSIHCLPIAQYGMLWEIYFNHHSMTVGPTENDMNAHHVAYWYTDLGRAIHLLYTPIQNIDNCSDQRVWWFGRALQEAHKVKHETIGLVT